jgi:predicted phage tail protein
MKLIEEVSIWDNGKIKKASILNAYAINFVLNESATFYYSLSTLNADGSQGEILASGNLSMTGDDYKNWASDEYVWKFISKSLNLVITGDYVARVVYQPIAEVVTEEPIVATVAETTTVEETTIEEAITEIPK